MMAGPVVVAVNKQRDAARAARKLASRMRWEGGGVHSVRPPDARHLALADAQNHRAVGLQGHIRRAAIGECLPSAAPNARPE